MRFDDDILLSLIDPKGMSNDIQYKELQSVAERAKVSDLPAHIVMSHRKPLTVLVGSKIYSVIQSLHSHGLSGAPVVDPSGRILGVITEHDLLLQAATKDLALAIDYNKSVIQVSPDTQLKEIIVIFYKKKVRWLPVVNREQKVVGVLHRIDILNCLINKGQRA